MRKSAVKTGRKGRLKSGPVRYSSWLDQSTIAVLDQIVESRAEPEVDNRSAAIRFLARLYAGGVLGPERG